MHAFLFKIPSCIVTNLQFCASIHSKLLDIKQTLESFMVTNVFCLIKHWWSSVMLQFVDVMRDPVHDFI
jgi:hypothetical protein